MSPDVSGESSQSGTQFQGRPSEVWSQWQNQHHSQPTGEQHTHPNPSQTEVFQVTVDIRSISMSLSAACHWKNVPSMCLQDMLPIPGDPTQGTANYNIEDFADLGMFPPFSE